MKFIRASKILDFTLSKIDVINTTEHVIPSGTDLTLMWAHVYEDGLASKYWVYWNNEIIGYTII